MTRDGDSDGSGVEPDPTEQRETVRRGYEDLGTAYLEARTTDPAAATVVDDLTAELPPDARVLDAGCGPGEPFTARLAAECDVVGLDFSAEQLRHARSAAPGAALVRGDMTALPFDARTVDAVTALFSVIHVPTEQHPAVYREFARVLRPGGRLLLTTGGEAWAGTNDDWLDAGVEMAWSFPSRAASKASLRDAGFAVEREWLVDDELGGSFPLVLARLD